MAVQFGTVDGLVNITNESIICFVKGIDAFESLGGTQYAKNKGISFGAAFQRFMDPVYQDSTKSFMLSSIDNPVYTKSGTEQSPARGTFCRKMGLAEIDESNDVFQKTPLAKAILNGEITIKEYAFILLSKMGIFTNGVYVDNVLRYIAMYFRSNSILSPNLLLTSIKNNYNDSNIVKTRADIIINALVLTGLITKVNTDVYVLSGTKQAEVFINYYLHSPSISKAVLDNSESYSEYVGNMEYGGIFDILPYVCMNQYDEFFPNLKKYIKTMITNGFNQQIFYGAPGTGKSNKIKKLTDGHSVIRTTFHPDSDYSTFVGCYKPTMSDEETRVVPVVVTSGISLDQNNGTYKEKRITYRFVMQAFLKAYLGAWKKYVDKEEDNVSPQFLVIEEINRGNCAQIFGDLFQLLDRSDNGFSEYPIEADTDLQQEIARAFTEHDDYKLNNAISVEGAVKNYTSNYDSTLSEDIQNGRVLLLPPNLYIWATMNTSDQSLFPIDSAFKRRWDWKYIKIAEGRDSETRELLNWTVKFNYNEDDKPYSFECSWWEFIKAINEKIASATSSDDKKLGYFFCKPEEKSSTIIDKERFVGKVVFYLWNDVFKDEENAFFKVNDSKGEPSFDAFYKEDENGDTVVDTSALRIFLHNVFGENKELYKETALSE